MCAGSALTRGLAVSPTPDPPGVRPDRPQRRPRRVPRPARAVPQRKPQSPVNRCTGCPVTKGTRFAHSPSYCYQSHSSTRFTPVINKCLPLLAYVADNAQVVATPRQRVVTASCDSGIAPSAQRVRSPKEIACATQQTGSSL